MNWIVNADFPTPKSTANKTRVMHCFNQATYHLHLRPQACTPSKTVPALCKYGVSRHESPPQTHPSSHFCFTLNGASIDRRTGEKKRRIRRKMGRATRRMEGYQKRSNSNCPLNGSTGDPSSTKQNHLSDLPSPKGSTLCSF